MSKTAEHMNEIHALLERELAGKSSHSWKEPGNKYDHGIRTAKLALNLKKRVFGDELLTLNGTPVTDELLTVAAWLHDICNGQDDHEKKGADYVRTLIAEYCSAEELDAVCTIITEHDHRTVSEIKTQPDIIKIHQDADLIDHLGTYDIWMTFSEFAHDHRTPMEYALQFENGIFARFEAKWRCQINYPESLAVFDERISFEKDFAARMLRELNGEII